MILSRPVYARITRKTDRQASCRRAEAPLHVNRCNAHCVRWVQARGSGARRGTLWHVEGELQKCSLARRASGSGGAAAAVRCAGRIAQICANGTPSVARAAQGRSRPAERSGLRRRQGAHSAAADKADHLHRGDCRNDHLRQLVLRGSPKGRLSRHSRSASPRLRSGQHVSALEMEKTTTSGQKA